MLHLSSFYTIDKRLVARPGRLANGRIRNGDRIGNGLSDDASGRERVAPDGAILVRHLEVDRDGAVGRIDGGRNAGHLTFELPAGGGETHELRYHEIVRLSCRNRRLEFEHVISHDRENRRPARQMFTRFHRTGRDDAGGGRDDACVLHVLIGGAQARVGGRETRLGRSQRLLRRAKVALGNRARLEEFVGLIGIPLRIGQIGLGRFAVGGGRGTIALLHGILEAGEELSARDTIALTHQHLLHVALHARAHGDLLDRLEVTADRDAGFDDSRRYGDHVGGPEHQRRGRATASATGSSTTFRGGATRRTGRAGGARRAGRIGFARLVARRLCEHEEHA